MTDDLPVETQENKPAKHPGGRPKIFNNCMDLEAAAQLYIESSIANVPLTNKKGEPVTDENGEVVYKEQFTRHLTISGLANALNLTARTLNNYSRDDELFPVIKKYRSICEQYTEESCFGRNAAGPIFLMKARYGTNEQSTIVHDHRVTVEGPMDTNRLKRLIEADDVVEAEYQEGSKS